MLIFFLLDGQTVDNEHEAVDFINQNIRSTVAFEMSMNMLVEEKNVSSIPGTNKLYKFRYIKSILLFKQIFSLTLFFTEQLIPVVNLWFTKCLVFVLPV